MQKRLEVLRNGKEVNKAVFDDTSGFIRFEKPVSLGETITIDYYFDADNKILGNVKVTSTYPWRLKAKNWLKRIFKFNTLWRR
jgi:hypothetical protein